MDRNMRDIRPTKTKVAREAEEQFERLRAQGKQPVDRETGRKLTKTKYIESIVAAFLGNPQQYVSRHFQNGREKGEEQLSKKYPGFFKQ